MNIQNKKLILRIDEELKQLFQEKCDKERMKVASRLKYLMQKDIEAKLTINV